MGPFLIILGAVATLVGLITVIRPMPKLGVATRRDAVGLIVGGFVMVVIGGAVLPPPDASEGMSDDAPAASAAAPVSDMTVAEYEALCADAPEGIFNQRCKGKRIVWDLFVTDVEDVRSAEMSVASVPGRLFDVTFADDVAWDGALDDYQGMKVQIAARIDAQRGYAHDLDDARALHWDVPYTAEETAAVQAAEEEAATRIAIADAQVMCEEELRRQAQFPSKVDCPFFGGSAGMRLDSGALLVQGRCDLRNGLGAMIPHTFRCIVNDGAVVQFEAAPGG